MIRKVCMVMLAAVACAQSNMQGEGDATAVPILVYHQFTTGDEAPGSDRISVARFERQMRYIAEHGYTTVTMDQLVAFMQGGDLPANPILLHFDDGWTSQLEVLQILKEHRFKASFWVFPEGRHPGMYMSWEEIRAIAHDPDFEVQSHSMTHPWHRESNLVSWIDGRTPGKTPEDAKHEISGSRQVLEAQLGRPVRYFAWPMGWYNEALVQLAREAGYEALLTIDEGANRRGEDVFRIKRIAVDGACTLEEFEEILVSHRYPACGGQPSPRISSSPYLDSR